VPGIDVRVQGNDKAKFNVQESLGAAWPMAQSTGEIVTHMDETGLNITQSSDSICNHPIAHHLPLCIYLTRTLKNFLPETTKNSRVTRLANDVSIIQSTIYFRSFILSVD